MATKECITTALPVALGDRGPRPATGRATPVPRRHRGRNGFAPVLALFGSVLWGVDSAAGLALTTATGPSATLRLVTSASMSTPVGSKIFANVNLMNSTYTPTGTVTFRLFGPTDPACAGTPMFTSTVAVRGTSVNSSRVVATQAGAYRWTTSYSGDDNYYPSGPTSCDSPAAGVVVAKARNVVRVTALPPTGGTLVARASLSGYYPNGTMTFVLSGPGDRYCASPILVTTVAVDGAGTYSSPGFQAATPGAYQWQASYGGDSDNRGASRTACWNPLASVLFIL